MINKQPPETIYLQWEYPAPGGGLTWFLDKMNNEDIEYRLAVQPGPPHPSWNDVLRAVDNLYRYWVENNKEQTGGAMRSAIYSLMQTYDDWLD